MMSRSGIVIFICLSLFCNCGRNAIGPDPADEHYAVFDVLWEELDEHYPYFDIKDVDWEEIHRSVTQVFDTSQQMTDLYLCEILAGMLFSLRDAHLCLRTPHMIIHSKAHGPPFVESDLDLTHIKDVYLKQYRSALNGRIIMGGINDTIGYLRIEDFVIEPDESMMNDVFCYIGEYKKVIIDIRKTLGGSLEYVEKYISRIISKKITYGYEQYKEGSGNNSFSKPVALTVEPKGKFSSQCVVLIDSLTVSAAEYFAQAASFSKDIFLIGTRTAGFFGSVRFKELPNGWILEYPFTRFLGSDKQLLEGVGVVPDSIVVKSFGGRNAILDAAIGYLSKN